MNFPGTRHSSARRLKMAVSVFEKRWSILSVRCVRVRDASAVFGFGGKTRITSARVFAARAFKLNPVYYLLLSPHTLRRPLFFSGPQKRGAKPIRKSSSVHMTNTGSGVCPGYNIYLFSIIICCAGWWVACCAWSACKTREMRS